MPTMGELLRQETGKPTMGDLLKQQPPTMGDLLKEQDRAPRQFMGYGPAGGYGELPSVARRIWTPIRTALSYLQVPQSAVMQSFEKAPQPGEQYGGLSLPKPLTGWSRALQQARKGEFPPDYIQRMFQAGHPWYLSLPLGLIADLATDPLTYIGVGPLAKMATGLKAFRASKAPQIARAVLGAEAEIGAVADATKVADWAAAHAYETVRAGHHPTRVGQLAPARAMEALSGRGTIPHAMDEATKRSFGRLAASFGSQFDEAGNLTELSPQAAGALRKMTEPAAADAARTGRSWIKLRVPFVPKAQLPIAPSPTGPIVQRILTHPKLEPLIGPLWRAVSTTARGPGGTMAAETVRQATTGPRQMMTEAAEALQRYGQSMPLEARQLILRADEIRIQPIQSFVEDLARYNQAPQIAQQRFPGATSTMNQLRQVVSEVFETLKAGGEPHQAAGVGQMSRHAAGYLADNATGLGKLAPEQAEGILAKGLAEAEKDAVADRLLKLSVIAQISEAQAKKAGIGPILRRQLLNLEMPPGMTVMQYDALLERAAKVPRVLWRDAGDLHTRWVPKIDLARAYERFGRRFIQEQITEPEVVGGVLSPEQIRPGYQAGILAREGAPLRESLRAIIRKDIGPVDEAALEQAAQVIEAIPRQVMREFRKAQKPGLQAAMEEVRRAGVPPAQERRLIRQAAALFKAGRPPAAARDWQLYLATHVDAARLPTVQSYLDHFGSRAGVRAIPGWIEFAGDSNPMRSAIGIGPAVRGFEKYKSLESPTKAALAGYQADIDMQGMLYGRYRASVHARSRKRLEDFMLGVGLPADHPEAGGRISLVEAGKAKGLSAQQISQSFPALVHGDLRFLPDVAHLLLQTRELRITEPALSWIAGLFYKLLTTWKGGVTVANNAWAMVNIQGMAINNFLRGVRDPRMYVLGAAAAAEHPQWQRLLGEMAAAAMPERVVKRGERFFVKLPMGEMDLAALHEGGKQYGWHSGWHTAALEDVPRASFLAKPPPKFLGALPKVFTPVVLRRLNRVANPISTNWFAYYPTRATSEGSEEIARHTLGIHQLVNGDGWAEASRIVRDTHFDYSELTPIERKIRGGLLPFYTWMRRNPEFQIGMLLHEPATAALVPRLVNALNQRFPPEQQLDRSLIQPWAQDTLTLQLTPAGDPGQPPYYGVIRAPVMDLSYLAQAQDILGSFGPWKLPIELRLNRSLFTGEPIDRAKAYVPEEIRWAFTDWEPAPWWAIYAPRWMQIEGFIMPGLDNETGKPIMYMSRTARYAIENAVPHLGQFSKWGVQPGQEPEKVLLYGVNKMQLLRWATGITARPLDEEQRQEVLQRQETQAQRGLEQQLQQRGLAPTRPQRPRRPPIPRP